MSSSTTPAWPVSSDNDTFGARMRSGRRSCVPARAAAATTTMQTRRFYRDGTPDESITRPTSWRPADQQDALQGRVQEGSEIAGGETDLVHNRVVAELKVEKNTAVTTENAAQFLGQQRATPRDSGRSSGSPSSSICPTADKQEEGPARAPGELRPLARAQAARPRQPGLRVSRCGSRRERERSPLPSDFAGRRVESSDALASSEVSSSGATPPNDETV